MVVYCPDTERYLWRQSGKVVQDVPVGAGVRLGPGLVHVDLELEFGTADIAIHMDTRIRDGVGRNAIATTFLLGPGHARRRLKRCFRTQFCVDI